MIAMNYYELDTKLHFRIETLTKLPFIKGWLVDLTCAYRIEPSALDRESGELTITECVVISLNYFYIQFFFFAWKANVTYPS